VDDILDTLDDIAKYPAKECFEFIIPPDVARRLVSDTLAQPGTQQMITKQVDRYAEMMLEGKWTMNDADIILLWRHDGIVEILNGKYRLAAIMKSNRAQRMVVVFVDRKPKEIKEKE
jgi:hypothetical protein